MCANVYLSIARSTFRSAALGPVRKFLIIVSALLNKESAPSTALEHSLRTKSSVTKSGQFYNKIKNLNFIIPTVCELLNTNFLQISTAIQDYYLPLKSYA